MRDLHSQPFKGVFPVAPTVFTDAHDIDYEGQGRVLDCMVDQGVDGICILANYSEQFVITDQERQDLVSFCLQHIANRVPVMVTCSHFSTRIAAERCVQAENEGASIVMLMPPYHGANLQASEGMMLEYFRQISDSIQIPIMIQDAPLSGVKLSPEFLSKLAADVPAVQYFKIETPEAAQKLRQLIAIGGDAIIGPFDGEEAITLMADLDAGATGTMCSALLPDLISGVVKAFVSGNREDALSQYARILPLINYENRQCGLRAAKTILMEGGVIKSDAVRHPLMPLHPHTRAGLLELAQQVQPLALTWGK